MLVWSNIDGLTDLLEEKDGVSIIAQSTGKVHIYCFASYLKRSELYTKIVNNMIVCNLWQKALPKKTLDLFVAYEQYELDMLQLKGIDFYPTSGTQDMFEMITFREYT